MKLINSLWVSLLFSQFNIHVVTENPLEKKIPFKYFFFLKFIRKYTFANMLLNVKTKER